MPNALAQESSPYLRQHAENPVDWLPWGPVALARAREQDRPLLVSIGYSACHWCHVMERESFEDARTAQLMNESFVCVKVDREERPDVDALYMEAVQGMTGQGGWPLNVFLTPEQLPFYGGTYFPPEPRHGHARLDPGAAGDRRGLGASTARRSAPAASACASTCPAAAQLKPSAEPRRRRRRSSRLSRTCADVFDARNGGFGGAPKFPQASALEFLLLRGEHDDGARDAARDGRRRHPRPARRRLSPLQRRRHLDGAALREDALRQRAARARLPARLAGRRASRAPAARSAATRWTGRCARCAARRAASTRALDADSEGVEGRFYVWTLAELRRRCSARTRDAAIAWLGATEQGNFADPHHPQPGLNVLTARGPRPEREHARAHPRRACCGARAQRTRPALDDKRLTSWNALMIAALADAGAALGERATTSTRRAPARSSCCASCATSAGGCCAPTTAAQAKIDAYLEDHAFLLEALLALFEATCEERWFHAGARRSPTR